MIRYPMTVPGAHPAAEGVFNEDVYVEALHPGYRVGFAFVDKRLWIDMPAACVNLVPAEELLNPAYHYVGQLPEGGSIILTDILTKTGPLDHEAKFVEADRIGMECVQLLHAGALTDPQQIHDFLTQSPDGIVVKPMTVSQQRRLVYVEITPDMFGPADDANTPASQEESCQTSSSVN